MNEVLSDKSSFSETDKKALEGSISAYASGSAGIEIFGNGGKIGGEIKGTASIGTGLTETQEYSRSLSKEGQAAFDKMYAEKLGNIIKSNDSVASAYSNALSTSTQVVNLLMPNKKHILIVKQVNTVKLYRQVIYLIWLKITLLKIIWVELENNKLLLQLKG